MIRADGYHRVATVADWEAVFSLPWKTKTELRHLGLLAEMYKKGNSARCIAESNVRSVDYSLRKLGGGKYRLLQNPGSTDVMLFAKRSHGDPVSPADELSDSLSKLGVLEQEEFLGIFVGIMRVYLRDRSVPAAE